MESGRDAQMLLFWVSQKDENMKSFIQKKSYVKQKNEETNDRLPLWAKRLVDLLEKGDDNATTE